MKLNPEKCFSRMKITCFLILSNRVMKRKRQVGSCSNTSVCLCSLEPEKKNINSLQSSGFPDDGDNDQAEGTLLSKI